MTTAANTEPEPAPAQAPTPEAAQKSARAAATALAAQMVRREALRWLTSDQITVLGQQVATSIDRYQQQHRRPPTWAESLAGIDTTLLAPLQTIPEGFPLRPALWRLELRQHLMTELKRTQWITYTRRTRSLHPSDHGRGWLTQHGAVNPVAAKPTTTPPTVPPPPASTAP